MGYLGHPFCPAVAEGLRPPTCPGSSVPASHSSLQLGCIYRDKVALFRHLIHIIQNYYRTIIKHYTILCNHQKAFKPCSEESFLNFLPGFSGMRIPVTSESLKTLGQLLPERNQGISGQDHPCHIFHVSQSAVYPTHFMRKSSRVTY